MLPKTRRAWISWSILILAVAATAPALASASSNSGAASPTPVDQQALQACIAQKTVNCETTVPGLAQCMAAHRVDCNQAATQQQPTAAASAEMGIGEAVSRALQFSPQATSQSPTLAKRMTLGEYVALDPNEASSFPGLALTRIVWVVTVHATIFSDPFPGQPPQSKNSYTIVFDALSRQGLVDCTGCATLG